ncbi:MAG: DMT family transporter [Thermoflexaceae bacterium]|nr:DMT family transporter [Thermoflexaceae bacterium]
MTVAPAAGLRGMRDLALISAGAASGGLAAVAISMVAAVGRKRGGEEATWLHLLVLLAAMSVVLGVAALRGKAPGFARPLHLGPAILVMGGLFALAALLSWRGIEWYYLASGLISTAIFLMITWMLVRVSLVLYFATSTLGMVFGSLAMDQIGAFGAPEHEITLPRALGALLVTVGVVVVRTGK